VLLIGLPAAVALFLLARPLLATLFFRGEFDAGDVAMAGGALQAFAPGLLGFILVKVLVAGFYSRQDARTPVLIGVSALLLGMVLNAVFVLTLLWTNWAPAHVGLAAATTISSLTNATLLFRSLVKAGVYRPRPELRRIVIRVAVACVVMAVFLIWLLDRAGDWLAMSEGLRVAWLTSVVGGGAAVYFAVAWVAGLRPAQFRMR
jgi:putative peptidoglycan lipid II flippase